ncbi:MAG: hypothetical protein JWM17_2907, partial [Actinobacteria bacterium]|nr:hypothetical protein [Actinomycetota bacterium]
MAACRHSLCESRHSRLVPAKGPWALPDLLDIPQGAPSTTEALEEQRADLSAPS